MVRERESEPGRTPRFQVRVSGPRLLPLGLPLCRPRDDGAHRNLLWSQKGLAFLSKSDVSHQPPKEHLRPTASRWSSKSRVLLAGPLVCSLSTTPVTLMTSH